MESLSQLDSWAMKMTTSIRLRELKAQMDTNVSQTGCLKNSEVVASAQCFRPSRPTPSFESLLGTLVRFWCQSTFVQIITALKEMLFSSAAVL